MPPTDEHHPPDPRGQSVRSAGAAQPSSAQGLPLSPYLAISRAVDKRRWDPTVRDLPLLGLYISTGSGILLAVVAVIYIGTSNAGKGLSAAATFAVVVYALCAALATRAILPPRHPWCWYFLFSSSLLMPLVDLAARAEYQVDAFLARVVLVYPVYLMVLPLYLARRRSLFGLPNWSGVM